MAQLELWGDSRGGADQTPKLRMFVNQDDKSIACHKLARCVYAETRASSLAAVESLCAMIKNSRRSIAEIAADSDIFESLKPDSIRHADHLVDYDDPGFQMCLRAVRRIGSDSILDNIFGATRFHRDDHLPEWATGIGSVAEVDGLSFYP